MSRRALRKTRTSPPRRTALQRRRASDLPARPVGSADPLASLNQDLAQLNQLFDSAREAVKQTKRVSGKLSELFTDLAHTVSPKS